MLKVENVIKSYNNREILKGVNLRIEDGEFVSIIGESGSGKSTLLSVISGNLKPDSGTVMLDGLNLSLATEKEIAELRRTTLGFVFQSLNLVSTLSAEDNIMLPLYIAKADISEGREYMLKLAKRMNISHLLSQMPSQMSGGERQRVAIARALVHHPRVLMLDEPTGSLDSKSTKEVLELLSELHKEIGITVIQVTHSKEAAAYADRIIQVMDGEVVTL